MKISRKHDDASLIFPSSIMQLPSSLSSALRSPVPGQRSAVNDQLRADAIGPTVYNTVGEPDYVSYSIREE